MKGVITPSVLLAVVCGASAQVSVLPESGELELLPGAEGVRIPPDLHLSNAGLREALSAHGKFDVRRRTRIDVCLSDDGAFRADDKPTRADLEPMMDASTPIPVVSDMIPGGVMTKRAQTEAPAAHVVELDLGEEIADFFGVRDKLRDALLGDTQVNAYRPIPEPTSLAALTVGFGGLIRLRLRKKAERPGSRRRR